MKVPILQPINPNEKEETESGFRNGPIEVYRPDLEQSKCNFALQLVNIGEFNNRYKALHEQIVMSSHSNYLEQNQLHKRTEASLLNNSPSWVKRPDFAQISESLSKSPS